MDVIVSSCTSLVHAAGAIGKKTFVIAPIAEYYIWVTTKDAGYWSKIISTKIIKYV